LKRKQIKLWATDKASAQFLSRKFGVETKSLLSFNKVQMYFACNKRIPESTMSQLDSALHSMMNDNTLAKINKKYVTN